MCVLENEGVWSALGKGSWKKRLRREERENRSCTPKGGGNIPESSGRSKQRHLSARDENVGPGRDGSGRNSRQGHPARLCDHVCFRPLFSWIGEVTRDRSATINAVKPHESLMKTQSCCISEKNLLQIEVSFPLL